MGHGPEEEPDRQGLRDLLAAEPNLVPLKRFAPALAAVGLVPFLVGLQGCTRYRVPSSAMEPTLRCKAGRPGCSGKQDDRLEVIQRFRIRRGDIVVFETPRLARQVCGAGGKYVKRVIGMPGEVVAERAGVVFVNGRRLPEPYIRPARRDSETHPPQRIARGRYYLLGDNRTASCDSRIWGTVPRRAVIAKVVAVQRGSRRIQVR